jgi:uncharacterized Zn finger protein
MPIVPCPHCPTADTPAPHAVERLGEAAAGSYYRCFRCGMVWIVPHGGQEPIRIIISPMDI